MRPFSGNACDTVTVTVDGFFGPFSAPVENILPFHPNVDILMAMSTTIVTEIEQRFARRAYSEKPVERKAVERLLTSATLAPSCSNKQSWRFLACTNDESLKKAREALNGGNYWALKAPVLIVATTKDDLDCKLSDDRNYSQFDLGLGVMNLLLQATHEGLYAHPMAGFDPLKVKENFGIDDDVRVMAVIAVGHPGSSEHLNEKHLASETAGRDRKPLGDVVQWDGWSGI